MVQNLGEALPGRMGDAALHDPAQCA